MVKQRHIGFTIFAICSTLSAKIAIFEAQPHELTTAEERWGIRQTDNSDSLRLIRGARYYIYGLGVLGLLMVVEDYVSERSRKKKARPKVESNEIKPAA